MPGRMFSTVSIEAFFRDFQSGAISVLCFGWYVGWLFVCLMGPMFGGD